METNPKVRECKRIRIADIMPNNDNIYELSDIKDLAENIALIGLEQNLVIKETEDPTRYLLVSGHRRYEAINYILDNGVKCSDAIKKEIEKPYCLVIPRYEDAYSMDKEAEVLKTQYRIHATNLNIRKISDAEKLKAIEDYLKIIKTMKDKGITINGKAVKGKTRDMLMEHFGLSNGQTAKIVSILNGSPDVVEEVKTGNIGINQAYNKNKERNKTIPTYHSALKQALEDNFATNVKVSNNAIVIKYTTEEELNRIVELLSEGIGNLNINK